MKYKELLNLVTFKEIEPHLVNMYPEAKGSLAGSSCITTCSD